MDLLRMLPLLSGWRWDAKDMDSPTIILPGGQLEVCRLIDKGWVWGASVSFSSEKPEFDITYDEYLRTSSTAEAAYGLGLTAPNATGFFCSKYDAGPPPIYAMSLMPVNPMPFNKKLVGVIKNPTALPIVMYQYAHLLVVIYNEDEFRKSIKKVLGVD